MSWRAVDAAVTGLLAGAAVGRIGCFRTGCCTGRPARVGAAYPWLGMAARRLPVPLLDAGACLSLAATTAVLHASAPAPGTAAAVGLGGYAVVRFALDELREERARTRRRSEAQRGMLLLAAGAAAMLAQRAPL